MENFALKKQKKKKSLCSSGDFNITGNVHRLTRYAAGSDITLFFL